MNLTKFLACAFALSALFTSCQDDPFVTPDPSGNDYSGKLFVNETSGSDDFVEIYNASSEDIDVSGFMVNDAAMFDEEAYMFPESSVIKAGGFAVVYKDTDFTFGISGSGDNIYLVDSDGQLVDNLVLPAEEDGMESYGRSADGGSTLVWFENSTPGRSNTDTTGGGGDEPEPDPETNVYGDLCINEGSSEEDFIEIYNASTTELNIGGLVLSDDKGFESEEAYTIPEGTVIAARGFYLATKDVEFEFGIGGEDLLQVFEADGTLISSLQLPDKKDGVVSYGCATDGDMANLVEFTASTPGASNVGGGSYEPSELIGKLLINEIYTYGDQTSVNDLDWIELYNNSDEEIVLTGLQMWESGGVEEAWTFPTGATIAARSYFVVETDKECFHNNTVDYPMWGLSKGPDEKIFLATAEGEMIDSVEDCPSMNEGESYGRATDGASEFQIFVAFTKGTANGGDARAEFVNTCGVYVNEVYHDNSGDVPGSHDWDTDRDFIELYNGNDADVSLKGWSMTDDKAEDFYYFPEDAVIKSGAFLVLDAQLEDDDKNPIPEDYAFPFGLGKGGDWVHIYDADGVLVEQVEVPSFKSDGPYGEIIDLGCTYGRETDGAANFVAFSEASKGSSNNGKAQK